MNKIKNFLLIFYILLLFKSIPIYVSASLCCQEVICLRKRQDIIVDILHKYSSILPSYYNFSMFFSNYLKKQQARFCCLESLVKEIQEKYIFCLKEKECFSELVNDLELKINIISKQIFDMSDERIKMYKILDALQINLTEEKSELDILKNSFCNC
jgi:hypothetical protein